jgi:hypothetical protein
MRICTFAKQPVGLKAMRKLPLIRPRLGELLHHVPILVKAYGKWPSYVYVFVVSLWTLLVVMGHLGWPPGGYVRGALACRCRMI